MHFDTYNLPGLPIARDHCHDDHPEPEEQVDHLVEQIDGQHALDCVTLDVTQTTHFEVTHCHAREPARLAPVTVTYQGINDVDS